MTVDPPSTSDELAYELPAHLIAQQPASRRGAARLLVVRAGQLQPVMLGTFDACFAEQLRTDDLVVANDSRVLHARVPTERTTGGRGELLLLHQLDSGAAPGWTRWECLARPARKLRDLELLQTRQGATVRCVRRTGPQAWLVDIPARADEVPQWLQVHGELPLPPYINGPSDEPDRYQTVHARSMGSVAAPTAGLHFDDAMWDQVRGKAEVAHVTLHVGAGTFLPVQDGLLDDHVMHHERYSMTSATHAAILGAIRDGRRIVAVGTTTTRVLEHAFDRQHAGELAGTTNLFIRPPYEWNCVGALLTNFHLPRSTLIALVMAFHGVKATRAAYASAIAEEMRFYSFGDALFIHGPPVGA